MESSSQSDISTFYGQCRCCLEYGYMKNLWTEYDYEGINEVYGEMLIETFSISWEMVDEMKEYICEHCISRLKDAFDFKKEVLESHKIVNENLNVLKEELEENVEMLEELEDTDNVDGLEEETMEEQNYVEVKSETSDTEYYEVEYLEEDENIETKDGDALNSEPKSDTKTETPKRKWPRKKKPGEITKSYRNYTEEDMMQCLDLVTRNKMSVSQASKLCGIPRKTVAAKISYVHRTKLETPEEIQKFQSRQKQLEFVSELKKVLSYTNAIPFKVKGFKYYCAYCVKDRQPFDDPDDLRAHSKTHKDIWLKRIDHILRPYSQNEVLRLDIDSLHCVECDTPILTWNDMFQHLREHGVKLDQTYTRVIPYKLRQDSINCALCDQKFLNFCFLDCHMNSHYCNYMCPECGDPFVAECRLKHHLEIHNKGKHPCKDCGKVFALGKYMRKHYAMVHKKAKAFKCMYCDERFKGEFERHSHVVQEHGEKIRVSTCEYCGKTFDWRPYYLAHIRKVHSKVKKNKCRYCEKAFVSKHELKLHEQRHTGSGKHVCQRCGKNYVTMMELRLHLKKHM